MSRQVGYMLKHTILLSPAFSPTRRGAQEGNWIANNTHFQLRNFPSLLQRLSKKNIQISPKGRCPTCPSRSSLRPSADWAKPSRGPGGAQRRPAPKSTKGRMEPWAWESGRALAGEQWQLALVYLGKRTFIGRIQREGGRGYKNQ